MRKFALITSACTVLLFASFAHAQQIDVAVGDSAILSSKYNSSSQVYLPPAEKGGTYPSFSADVIFKNRFGFNGEVAVRAKQGLYNNYQGFRPIFYDFNAVFAPRFGEKISAEFMGGVGGESIRFYNPTGNCSYPTVAPPTSAVITCWCMWAAASVTTSGTAFSSGPRHTCI